MSDEMGMSEDAEKTKANPPIVHDDIMQRLLDYQRRLREGLSPEQAAQSNGTPVVVDHAPSESPAPIATQADTVEVVDLAAVEGAIEEPIEVIGGVEVVHAADESERASADAVPQVWADSSTGPEPTSVPTTADAADLAADLAARLSRLEDTLSSVAKSIGDLREQFQNMAIAADDRLGVIESMISSAKDDLADAS